MNSEVCKWLFKKFGGKDNTNFKFSFGDDDNSEKLENNSLDTAIATNISACIAEAQAKNTEAMKYISSIK